MLELLAPAGSPEAVVAAVQSGADAIYLGYGSFNARRNAKNFTEEEFAAAVSYCHLRDVKVHLTLNTLVTDRELPAAAEQAARAAALGVDAVIVQDLGLARALRQTIPSLPLHASTQMSVHNLDGVKAAADLGFTRVVLARELSQKELDVICTHVPIETEVFAHGALCMCFSGQCEMSALIGTRSGNRGLCAQPCRLSYGFGGKPDGAPLSLKDLSLASHIHALKKLGVTCLKIEGRMKRPEYVAVVTSIYASLIREDRLPTEEELKQLTAAFSRQGFTDGYFTGRTGKAMFGVREQQQEPAALFAAARAAYEEGSARRVPVALYAMIRKGEPARVAVEDARYGVFTAEGPVPEAARTRALTRDIVENQLSRTGGTPFRAQSVKALVEEGLSLPLSALNALRRDVLDQLTRAREALPDRPAAPFKAGIRYENPKDPPGFTVSLRRYDQLSDQLLALRPERLYLPVDEIAAHPEAAKQCQAAGVPLCVTLPRVVFDSERTQVVSLLDTATGLNVSEVLTGDLGLARLAAEKGFLLRGDFGLPVFNSQTEKELKRLGFRSVTASFELKLPQIRDLSKAVDTELIVYGRLPLMITQNCILKSGTGHCGCDSQAVLTDRLGERFPILKAFGCRSELFNGKQLFLADKAADWAKVGARWARLSFTTENAKECVAALQRYQGQGRWTPHAFTRGLYYRGVE